MGNYGFFDFPDSNSSLANICFQSFDEPEGLIDEASEIDETAFFKKMKLEGYRYDSYPIVKAKYLSII